ncbi:MAG TPA: L,D-transpeptidase/peptidoglycan binding protein [Candidatus Blautia faecavium]|uniref:L,D-transpeptidase/peptidoglycan binding protein n=1 Tax=Candidatus Blautia faecavium TaxID=2838487 RepID=A0A9D2RVQ1_9FIRM|nr:L,D-transpeptidase/peptidoglycan binding protein [Candidatus Blautia faecavium]
MKKRITISRKGKKIILGICLAGIVLLSVGLFAYIRIVDTNTLGRGISINGLDVSRLTVEEAGQKILATFQEREVVFVEDGEEVYHTTLAELGYSLEENSLNEQLETLKAEREKEKRILSVRENYELKLQVQENEEQQKTLLTSDKFGNKERTPSVDAAIQYDQDAGKFTLISEVQGNQIDEARLQAYVKQTLQTVFQEDPLGGDITLTMGTEVYQQPAATSDGEEMQVRLTNLNTLLNNYRNAAVTYTFGSTEETLDSSTVASWIKIGEDSVSIDEEAAKAYIQNLAASYNTIYVPRTFHTSYGNDVTIENNEYGFQIDQEGELAQLLEDLKSGTAVRRDPVYSISGMQRNGKDDLAGSYIEVSLDNQHLWLYKDGALVTETDIISGAPGEDTETYRGAWPIAYKASPFTLSSDVYGYEVEVQYWMPFVYGQGLHDASWQSNFGGNSYRTGSGSHGCINLPADQAAVIYNAIDGGYPIIIY